MPLTQGQILNNRYRIAKAVDTNNFGTTYRAWDLILKSACLIEEIFDTGSSRAIFERQSPRLMNLMHPHLARVYDAVSLPGHSMYLALEVSEGDNLQSILEQSNQTFPTAQAINWISKICDALIYLHTMQPPLVHCNLKPANIHMLSDGRPILIGLGAMTVYDAQSRTLFITHGVEAGYSPPEQYRNGKIDARADVYALGATLYTLLSGKVLPDSTMIKGKDVPTPLALHEINPEIDSGVSDAVSRAIQVEPNERFTSISEFRQALTQAPKIDVSVPPFIFEVKPPRKLPFSGRGLLRALLKVLLVLLVISGLVAGGLFAYPLITNFLQKTPETATATRTTTATTRQAVFPTTAVATLPSPTEEPTSSPLPVETPFTTELPGLWQDETGVMMALVPAGKFKMGSDQGELAESPVHDVTLDTFYIDQYEVTNAHYQACVDTGTCLPPLEFRSKRQADYYKNPDFADYPVIFVTWDMARTYCSWRGGRLPTEAEWEKAARGEDGRTYPWGEQAPTCSIASFWNDELNCLADVKKVGSFLENISPYQVFDMAGNVWEWVLDWFSETYYANSPAENPTGPETGTHRVMRGGSWTNGAQSIRTTIRGRNLPDTGFNYTGIRCARNP